MKLSLFLDPQEGMTYRTLRAATLQAEKSGFYGMYRSDHLTSTADHFERAATEAWSTLAGLAAETSDPPGHPGHAGGLSAPIAVCKNRQYCRRNE